ncbi:hypothetical protein RhiirA5_407547 [Rhizophagus irregularis]|uniref:Uncharacterized protein n=1 Tax=Rhizophagus irregularis TaxID=588596 RepID=A0A2N0QA92_9GLOM|nr:hypothetical protein RhiirA5_407547 [Rhizophagus irregularis]
MKLSFCKNFEPCQVKYILEDLEDIEPDLVPRVNPLPILMVNSQRYCLPVAHKSSTRRDLLFNDILWILQQNSLGWTRGMHETFEDKFINCLIIDLLWYHRSKNEKSGTNRSPIR